LQTSAQSPGASAELGQMRRAAGRLRAEKPARVCGLADAAIPLLASLDRLEVDPSVAECSTERVSGDPRRSVEHARVAQDKASAVRR
jgi:hypothetical protein